MSSTITALTSGGGLAMAGDTSGQLELKTNNGTTAVTINTAQGAQFLNTIGVGNATPSTSGAGITFPATQSASSNANTLDDYEEGTFTPVDASGAGLSFTSVSATYVKIGKTVNIQFSVTYPTTASTAAASISGFPFTSGAGTPNPGGGSMIYNGSSYTASIFMPMTASGNQFTFYTNVGGTIQNVSFSGAVMRANFTYTTAN